MKISFTFIAGLGLLFSSILCAEETNAPPQKRLSEETRALFLKTAESCKKASKSSAEIFETYFGILDYDTISEDRYDKTNVKYVDEQFDYYDCDRELFAKYKESFKKDALPYFKKMLAKNVATVEKLKKKKLDFNYELTLYQKNLSDFEIIDEDNNQKMLPILEEAAVLAKKRQETCTDVVNLDPSLDKEKPRNQDSIGWCYAYSAADLISHALGEKASAVHVAAKYNDRFFNRILGAKEGGYIDSAIENLKKSGVCLEKDLPSEDYLFSLLGDSQNLATTFYEVFKFVKEIKKQKISTVEDVQALLCQNPTLNNPLQELFPHLKKEEIAEVLLESSRSRSFKNLVDKNCPLTKKEELQKLQVKKINFIQSADKKWATIDEQLNKGNILGIHYDADFLVNPNAKSARPNHASSIIGRRFNPKTNSCEYLLRNSWGTDCGIYSDFYKCENGNIWISEVFYKKVGTIKEVIYVEKK